MQAALLFLHGVDMMREHIHPLCRMHYYIADGGKAVNTVPDYAKVVFRFRAPSADTVAKNIAWVKDIARGAGLATQTKEKITTVTVFGAVSKGPVELSFHWFNVEAGSRFAILGLSLAF